MYKAEAVLKVKNGDGTYNDPLEWWKKRSGVFPKLSEMALRLLSVPATSAPSERIFSMAKQIITDKRNRLDPSTAGDLIFLHDSIDILNEHGIRVVE